MSAKLLGQFYHADGVPGADMLDIDEGTGVQGQHAVAGYQNILCGSRRAANAEVLGHGTAVDAVIGDKALAERKKLLNPLNYIGSDSVDTAEHIRIRVGTQDADTALSVSAVLALSLENKTDADVDYALVWNQGHGNADYDGELLQWIDKICKE